MFLFGFQKVLDGPELDGPEILGKTLSKSINEIWTGFKLISKLPKISISIPDLRGAICIVFVIFESVFGHFEKTAKTYF